MAGSAAREIPQPGLWDIRTVVGPSSVVQLGCGRTAKGKLRRCFHSVQHFDGDVAHFDVAPLGFIHQLVERLSGSQPCNAIRAPLAMSMSERERSAFSSWVTVSLEYCQRPALLIA